jgi:hypothetical protein
MPFSKLLNTLSQSCTGPVLTVLVSLLSDESLSKGICGSVRSQLAVEAVKDTDRV